jgi:hypothetical protein
MLPLALAGSLVLLLSSLSLQGMVLQGRQVQALEQRSLRAEDQLASAAQQLLGQLQGPYACLYGLPSSEWRPEALPPACPAGLALEPLRRWSVDGSPVELIRWDPLLAAPELWLQQGGGGLQRGFRMGAGGLQQLGG